MTGAVNRFPWGAGRAPALRCDQCRRRIGQRRFHCVVDNTKLLCSRCLGDRGLHAKYYPACAEDWHDMYDHPLKLATRAAAWFVLDSPERKQAP
jgi:hypothetical protein